MGVQIANYGGTDRGLPDFMERVDAKKTGLLGIKLCFGASWLNPEIRARLGN